MVSILIIGHGNYATGALSATRLVAGAPENVYALDFEEGMSPEELKEKMSALLASIPDKEVLIMADLAGGTPFRTAVELKMTQTGKDVRVVAGANMPALMEAAFSSDSMGLAELAADVLQTGVEGFMDWDAQSDDSEEPDFEGGL
ncbi:PTS sugar transporter subunit IIA [uncultured Gemmiger sp.]|uniref:PTS sugar transporter subunit IIA n=1 Tax=uncultured Gemmiger sp. TaxID=1623490 RepID=UPI0025F236D3|nr:PTS sugar transporter subunit IIA [uncultured Gemmiger sp.]